MGSVPLFPVRVRQFGLCLQQIKRVLPLSVMRFSEERKWRKSKVTGWNLKLFEYLRSYPILVPYFMNKKEKVINTGSVPIFLRIVFDFVKVEKDKVDDIFLLVIGTHGEVY